MLWKKLRSTTNPLSQIPVSTSSASGRPKQQNYGQGDTHWGLTRRHPLEHSWKELTQFTVEKGRQ